MKKANPTVDLTNLSHEMLCKLNEIEVMTGLDLTINSAYRRADHPIEAAKLRPGEHTEGNAVDIACDAVSCYKIVQAAFTLGINRIGIKRPSGGTGFVHLGVSKKRIQNRIWTY